MQTIPTLNNSSDLIRTIRKINYVLRSIPVVEYRSRKYGDFYQMRFKNSPPTVFVSNPEAIAEIFTAPLDTFQVGRSNRGLSFLFGDRSLLLLDGKEHKNHRRLLMPNFHGESLQKYSQKIVNITRTVCERWEIDKPFQIRDPMQEITLRTILTVVFGIDSKARYDRLRQLFVRLLETFNHPLGSSFIFFPSLQKDLGPFTPWANFIRIQKEIKNLIYTEIAEKRALLTEKSAAPEDILSLLILAKDENGEQMSDRELHDELITLLFAGHDTTASALSWLFYWLHYLPEIQEKLRFELSNLANDLDYKTVNNLPYLNATISENLRIYPIAINTFPRILSKPISLMGHDFEPGTWFLVSLYALHHKEDLYPNSKQFQPARFLNKNYSPYEYIPFGGGNRRCLGAALALLEMKLVTATILSSFELDLIKKQPIKPVRRGLTMAPPPSLTMVVKNKIE